MNKARLALRLVVPVTVIAALLSVPIGARAEVTFTVNSTDDSSDGLCAPLTAETDCTLREAIENANTSVGLDTIDFDIPGDAPFVIDLESELPHITDPVLIDGRSQSGFNPNSVEAPPPVIVIEGNSEIARGLQLDAATDTTAGSDGSTIQALAVNGFGHYAIAADSAENQFSGNYLGIEVDGSTADGNGNGGILLTSAASDNYAGGLSLSDRNVISGNGGWGVQVMGDNNVVRENYIGTDATGTSAVPNGTGIEVSGSSNTIGGADPAIGNVISGNFLDGLTVESSDNVVQNNLVGTKATGTGDLGNGGDGVLVDDASFTTVGEPNPFPGDLAALNGGGPNGNVIAHNGGNGVEVTGVEASGNTISENSIFANDDLGIDLGGGGVDTNDFNFSEEMPPDTDGGPNGHQNYPQITGVEVFASEGIETDVTAQLYSTPNTDFTIDYYSSNGCDPSGNGEGRFFEGSITATTDDSGFADASAFFGQMQGTEVTATATDQETGDTSEFSNCEHVPTLLDTDFGITKSDAAPNGPDPVTAGNNVAYALNVTNNGPDDATGVAVTDDLPPEASFVSASGPGWNCIYDGEVHRLFCTRGALANGVTRSIIIVVKAPSTPPDGCEADSELASCITDSAEVSAAGPDDEFDGNPDNDNATESTEVQPKPANSDDSTGFVPKGGGTVTTGNNPNAADPTDASVTLPGGGPGGVVSIHEQVPPDNFCGNDDCSGKAVLVQIPDGYENPNQPPRLVLKYDVTVVRPKGGAKIYIQKGSETPVLVPLCTEHGVANPSPCIGSRQRLPNGDLRVTVLLLSGDPLCGKH